MDHEFVEEVCKSGKIDMGNQYVGLDMIELILTVLRVRGSIEVKNCGGVATSIELGAYLRNVHS